MAKEKNKYQDSMHLPKTGFPMRAGLAKAEPKRLADWNENHLYEQVARRTRDTSALSCTTAPRMPTARSTLATL